MSNIIYEDGKHTVWEDDEENICVIDKRNDLVLNIQYGDNTELRSSLDASLDVEYIVYGLLGYDRSDWL